MATYDAFISYSHANDKAVAAALQAAVQRLGKPWYRRRALRIFRDDTSLSATPHLWPAIESALERSRYLILIASPEAASSQWVAKEVAYWLEHKSVDTLLIALTDGELAWDRTAGDFGWGNDTPLPSVLRGRLPSEPKWVDLRSYRGGVRRRDRGFKERNADFAAVIHDIPKEDILSQEVRQQRQALTLAWSAAASLLVLAGAAGWQWQEAVAQRDRAEAALVQANRNFDAATSVGSGVVDIVRNLISSGTISTKVAEPLLDVTRKTIQQLDSETPNPKLSSLQWRLLNALSFAYIDVPGQGESAVDLARKMLALSQELVAAAPDDDDFQELLIKSEIRVGDTLEARGILDEGLQHLLRAREALVRLVDKDPSNGDRVRTLVYLQQRIGDFLRRKDDIPAALNEYRSNLALAQSLAPHPQAKPDWMRARALAHQRMGDILRDGGDLGGALVHFRSYRDLMEMLVKTELPNAPNWTWRLDLWIGHQRIGDILFAQKDYAAALVEYEFYNKRAGEAARLDADNGEWQRFLANSHVLIGDVLLAQDSAALALAQYTTAVVIYRDVAKDFRPRSLRNLALGHYRMGMARLAMGEAGQAQVEFEACLAIQVDETALDAQILTPKLVKSACQERSAQTTGNIAGR
ncbi:MAG: TIR domain-containing protein [Xanthobacteraceae bacterium]|nr:TIR domain-containing protein [Xanthobacteraceae bacterium]